MNRTTKEVPVSDFNMPKDWELLQADRMDLADYVDKYFNELFEEFQDEMPYGVAKARCGDPYNWIADRLSGGFLEE